MSPKRMNSLWLMAIFLTVNFIFSVVLFFKWTSDLRCQRLQILDNTKKIQAKIHNKNVLSCQPPVLSLDREEMFHFFSKAPGIRPNCSESPNWIEIENHKIRFSNDALKRFSSIRCDLNPIVRPEGEDFWASLSDGFSFDEKQNPTLLNDFFYIQCLSNSGENYSNFHLAIRYDEKLKRRNIENPISDDHLGYNVLMLAFDSVSRMSLMRFLPKSYSYLTKQLGSVVMKGYNIVGDGTTPNMLALLTGQRIHTAFSRYRGKNNFTDQVIQFLPNFERSIQVLNQMKRKTFPNYSRDGEMRTIDHFSWIWKLYQKNGFITQWIEDWFPIGSLNWRLTGFYDPPVDLYGRPFYLWMEKQRPLHTDHCLGSISRYKAMLTWIDDLFKSFPSKNEKLFSLAFHKKYTHNGYDSFHYADDELVEFLQKFHRRGEFERTVLIFFTDHGPRFAKVRKTSQGRLEELLPFLSIRMPIEFQKKYPQIMKNLELNSERLTTPFDLHQTLLHIAQFHSKTRNQTSEKHSSLFDLLPHDRTCRDVFINDHHCACHKWNTVPVRNSTVVDLASSVIRYFKTILSNNQTLKLCAELTVNRIIQARILDSHERQTNPNSVSTFQIQLETKPGNGLFEITAPFHPDDKTFDIRREHISRINSYGMSSSCIAEKRVDLRDICFCLNQNKNREHQ